VSANASAVVYAFLGAGIALVAILLALAVTLVLYQRRFLSMHRNYAEGLLRTQEQERAWVAREVHDDALQRIMMLVHELDDWAQVPHGNGATPAQRLQALRLELEDLSLVLRRMAYRLHPAFVEQSSIEELLHRVAGEAERMGMQVEIRGDAGLMASLPPERALVLYRIAQEALTNVSRHAETEYAVLEVQRREGALEVTILDFGAGFDPNGARRRGLGLLSMHERARAAGGILSVESHPGGGTRVQLQLPVEAGA